MKGGWRHEGGRGESYNLFLKHRKVKMGEEGEEGGPREEGKETSIKSEKISHRPLKGLVCDIYIFYFVKKL